MNNAPAPQPAATGDPAGEIQSPLGEIRTGWSGVSGLPSEVKALRESNEKLVGDLKEVRRQLLVRVNGWAEVLQLFGDPEANILPRLFIHRRCGRLVETLPSLQHDPNRPEDVLKVDADEDGVGGDDAADALRYLVATRARTVAQRKLRGL